MMKHFYFTSTLSCIVWKGIPIVQTESIAFGPKSKKEPSIMRVYRPGKGNIADMVIFITIGYNNLNKQFILFLTGPILYCIAIYHDVFQFDN